MLSAQHPPSNHFLAALPEAAAERLLPHLESIPLAAGEVLHEPGQALHHAYFPTTAVASLLHMRQDGVPEEIASIGSETFLGAAPCIGGEALPLAVVIGVTGFGCRVEARLLRQALHAAGSMMFLFLRHQQAVAAQMAQVAFCNHHHTPDQQLSRRLLLWLDRLPAGDATLPASLFPGMDEAIARLQRAGLIECSRGRLAVLDRAALERRACECYAAVKGTLAPLSPQLGRRAAAGARMPRPDLPGARGWRSHPPSHVEVGKRP
jgi:hypothetical protein